MTAPRESAPEDEGGIEADVALFQILPVTSLDIAHCVGYQHRDVEHGRRAPEVGSRVACGTALVQHADHSLGTSEIAGTQQDDHAVAASLEHRHLAVLGEVIQARIRTGIRGENHPLVEHQANAVGHASRSLFSRYRFWMTPSACLALQAEANDVCTVLIRLSQTPTGGSGFGSDGVKLGIGWRSDIAGDAEQGAESVEWVEAAVEAESEFVEIG